MLIIAFKRIRNAILMIKLGGYVLNGKNNFSCTDPNPTYFLLIRKIQSMICPELKDTEFLFIYLVIYLVLYCVVVIKGAMLLRSGRLPPTCGSMCTSLCPLALTFGWCGGETDRRKRIRGRSNQTMNMLTFDLSTVASHILETCKAISVCNE